MELSIPWFWVKGRKAHMGLFHFWARGPPRPPASLSTRLPKKAEAETIRAVVVVVSASFRCLSMSERVGQKIPCYQVQAHDGRGRLRTGNELPANALTIKDASWFRL